MDHINWKKNTISIDTYKIHNRVIIPIHKRVKEILGKYYNRTPKPQCNQSANRLLKKLCDNAGITELMTYTETVGGKRKEQTVRKCDKVTIPYKQRHHNFHFWLKSSSLQATFS